MSHGVNKICITRMPKAATRWRSFEIHKTQLDIAGKALHFLFLISHCMLAVRALASFSLDVVIVLITGSDSFSQIWSHGARSIDRSIDREREREGGGSDTEQNFLHGCTPHPSLAHSASSYSVTCSLITSLQDQQPAELRNTTYQP